jgi:hypothetical protein
MALIGCGVQQDHGPTRYLEAARQTAAWLDATALERDGARSWPSWTESDQPGGPTLGSGVGGPVLFYLALARATGEDRYLRSAVAGGRYLLDTLDAVLTNAQDQRAPESLYGGLPSAALVLEALYDATDDPAYRHGAESVVARLHEMALAVDDGVEWTPYNDVLFGSAGAGLFLLEVARRWDHAASLDLAQRIGATLLARAEPSDSGATWRFRRDREIYLPNFSHGAAGIGFFLARLHQATGERRYLEAALEAAEYLTAIARTEADGFIIPYSVPNGQFSASWDIGWAHGPAGVVRFFSLLWQITGDERWSRAVDASVRALRNAGVPGTPAPEFETDAFRLDLRFGTASVATMLLDLSQADGRLEYLDYGREVVDTILAHSRVDSLGRHWTIAQYGFMPEEGAPATFTGYFYGAAGYGLTLLRLDGALRDQRWETALPDNPWASQTGRASAAEDGVRAVLSSLSPSRIPQRRTP